MSSNQGNAHMADESLIDPTKPVQTHDGRKAKILATGVLERFPGSGVRFDGQTLAVVFEGGLVVGYFFPDGRALVGGDSSLDLINIPESAPDEEPRGSLAEAAQDYAMIAAALCSGRARWELLSRTASCGVISGEFCIDDIRCLTSLDKFGVPRMTEGMRAIIAKAEGR